LKHISDFKIFESINWLEIIRDCEDILLELSDDGFRTEISKGKSPHEWILIDITRKDIFSAEDIKETVERLKKYLGEVGFKTYNSYSNYPNIISNPVLNSYTFEIDYRILKTSIQFNKIGTKHFSGHLKLSESKYESVKVSDIKYDLEDILLDLKDNNFEIKININDWNKNYKSIPDESKVNWISIEISKKGDWDLTDIDEYIIQVVNFLSINGLYPLFEPNINSNMETALISNHADKFKNRLHKVAGTTDTYAYDIQFKSDYLI
jgi:hypothetical protein